MRNIKNINKITILILVIIAFIPFFALIFFKKINGNQDYNPLYLISGLLMLFLVVYNQISGASFKRTEFVLFQRFKLINMEKFVIGLFILNIFLEKDLYATRTHMQYFYILTLAVFFLSTLRIKQNKIQ